MPQPGLRWWHVILGTRGSWLPGDPRGFRSRGHRIHSSGDYHDSPPADEHAGLHTYQRRRAAAAVLVSSELRRMVGQGLLAALQKKDHRCLAIAVDATHTHMLLELHVDVARVTRLVGYLKQTSSRAVSNHLPGHVWARGGRPIPIGDRGHQMRVYRYILRHAENGAWVWDFRAGEYGGW